MKEIEEKKQIQRLRYRYQRYLYDITFNQEIETAKLQDHNYMLWYQKENYKEKV